MVCGGKFLLNLTASGNCRSWTQVWMTFNTMSSILPQWEHWSVCGHRSWRTNMRSWKTAEDKFWQYDDLPQAALVSGTQLRMGWNEWAEDNWYFKTLSQSNFPADTQTLPKPFPRNPLSITTLPSGTYLVASGAGLRSEIALGISLSGQEKRISLCEN